MPSPILDIRGLSKSFPGVRALDAVDLHMSAGEVLAVVGENGAGKSTLMRILAGVETADAGTIHFNGQLVRFRNVREALAAGIVLIHQELNLAENLSVAGNIFLGREIASFGWLDHRVMAELSRTLLERVGLRVSPETPVQNLAIGQRQLVEIARALGQSARLIIMDEPTSSLSPNEVETLFGVIRELKSAGVAVVYISHRLDEVKTIADRVTVLRDGRNAGELAQGQIHHDAIVRLMVGRDLRPRDRPALPVHGATPRLEAHGLRFAPGGPPIDLRIDAGEVLGLAGLVGAGRTELAEALVGLRPIAAGELRLDGKPIRIRSPRDALRYGIVLSPEDRRALGLIVNDSVQDNLTLVNLDRLNSWGLIHRFAERALARGLVDRLRIKTPWLGQPVGLLSGGNQQKVVLGKWLARKPRVLILDEPTRGVDVGARSEIYRLIDELAAEGAAVLMISSDLEEIIAMSHRVAVMHQGQIRGELGRDRVSEEAIMTLATGGGA